MMAVPVVRDLKQQTLQQRQEQPTLRERQTPGKSNQEILSEHPFPITYSDRVLQLGLQTQAVSGPQHSSQNHKARGRHAFTPKCAGHAFMDGPHFMPVREYVCLSMHI